MRHNRPDYRKTELDERLRPISNGLAVVQSGPPGFLEAQRGMERVGAGIWWIEINLAPDHVVTGGGGCLEEMFVQTAGMPPAAGRRRNDDPVDIYELRLTFPKPTEVWARVIRVLIHRDQKRFRIRGRADTGGEERLPDQMIERRAIELRRLARMRIVQGEYGSAIEQRQPLDLYRTALSFRQNTSYAAAGVAIRSLTLARW